MIERKGEGIVLIELINEYNRIESISISIRKQNITYSYRMDDPFDDGGVTRTNSTVDGVDGQAAG